MVKKDDRKVASRPALLAVVLIALFSPLAEGQAQSRFCAKPFADRAQEIICPDAEARRSEWNLQTQIRALKELLVAFEFETFEKEQARWSGERQRTCEAEPIEQKAACYEAQAGNRASVLQRQVAGALKDGMASFSLRGATLGARWRVDKETGTVFTQLRHGDKVLTEVVGADKFDVVGRAGNAEAEAIVIRSRKNVVTFVVVGREETLPEIWRYWPSRPWMKQPPVVDAKGERLRLKEQVEKPSFETIEMAFPAILEWTPSGGWTIAQPFRIKAVLPKGRQFDGHARPGEACKIPFESTDTVRLGSRILAIGKKSRESDFDSEPWGADVLAFGCDLLIAGYARGFDLDSERRINGASVVLSTEYNGGNGGFVDRHVLADVPGHGIQVWAFPKSEVGPDNDVSVIATSFGYLFLTPAYPGMEGGVYRWTPTAGYTFDGYRPFAPRGSMPNVAAVKPDEDSSDVSENVLNNEDVHRAFTTAAGPSFIGRAFDLSSSGAWSRSRIDRQWAPDLVVFSDCDGSRHCNGSGGRMIGVFRRKTQTFYFVFQQNPRIFSVGNAEPPPPAIREFHPPLELWPEDAAKVIEAIVQGDVVLK